MSAQSRVRWGIGRDNIISQIHTDSPLSDVARRLDAELTTREGDSYSNRVNTCYSQVGLTPKQIMMAARKRA